MLEEVDKLNDFLLGIFITSHIFEPHVNLFVLTVDGNLRFLHIAHLVHATEPATVISGFLVSCTFPALANVRGSDSAIDLPTCKQGKASHEKHERIRSRFVIHVLDWDELSWLLAHLALNLIELRQEAFLGAEDHVETLSVCCVNVRSMVKDFAARVL